MKRPIARPTTPAADLPEPFRAPRAFAPAKVEEAEAEFETAPDETLVAPAPRRMGWVARLAWTSGGILVSAALGLAADRLIRDLFATNEWLGWLGLGVLGVFLVAVLALTAGQAEALVRKLQTILWETMQTAPPLGTDYPEGAEPFAVILHACPRPPEDEVLP